MPILIAQDQRWFNNPFDRARMQAFEGNTDTRWFANGNRQAAEAPGDYPDCYLYGLSDPSQVRPSMYESATGFGRCDGLGVAGMMSGRVLHASGVNTDNPHDLEQSGTGGLPIYGSGLYAQRAVPELRFRDTHGTDSAHDSSVHGAGWHGVGSVPLYGSGQFGGGGAYTRGPGNTQFVGDMMPGDLYNNGFYSQGYLPSHNLGQMETSYASGTTWGQHQPEDAFMAGDINSGGSIGQGIFWNNDVRFNGESNAARYAGQNDCEHTHFHLVCFRGTPRDLSCFLHANDDIQYG